MYVFCLFVIPACLMRGDCSASVGWQQWADCIPKSSWFPWLWLCAARPLLHYRQHHVCVNLTVLSSATMVHRTCWYLNLWYIQTCWMVPYCMWSSYNYCAIICCWFIICSLRQSCPRVLKHSQGSVRIFKRKLKTYLSTSAFNKIRLSCSLHFILMSLRNRCCWNGAPWWPGRLRRRPPAQHPWFELDWRPGWC